MARFVSGLDWSGDPGSPSRAVQGNQLFVMCACHVSRDDLGEVAVRWDQLKRELGLPSGHTFKHVRSRPVTREKFFRLVGSLPLLFTVEIVDKTRWRSAYLADTNGGDRVLDSICALFENCSVEIVANQILVVDAHRSEVGFLRDVRLELRRSQAVRGNRSFKKISALPDHRQDAMLIQAADMMAGEIRRMNGQVPSSCVGNVKINWECD